MSKILRRPMFRGGPVDSRGTGITSGLFDAPSYAMGGTVETPKRGVVDGPGSYSFRNTDLLSENLKLKSPGAESLMANAIKTNLPKFKALYLIISIKFLELIGVLSLTILGL